MTGSDNETSATNESNDGTPPWWHAAFEDDESVAGVGTAAQEAVKLAAAVANWANDSGVAEMVKSVVEQAGDTLRSAAATASAAAASAAAAGAAEASATAAGAAAAGAAEASATAAGAAEASATAAGAAEASAAEANTASTAPISGSHAAGTCEVCPICQGVEVLRTVSPETASGVADALALVTGALRQAIETFGNEPDAPSDECESASGVQHIKID